MRESQGFFRKNKEMIVWKRSERKLWQRLLSAEKLYGLTSWLIHWIVLKITLKGTPSLYTQVPTDILEFLFSMLSVESRDWCFINDIPRQSLQPLSAAVRVLLSAAIDQLILILGYNKCGIFVKLALVTWWSLEEWCASVLVVLFIVDGVWGFFLQSGLNQMFVCFVFTFFHVGLYLRTSCRMSGVFSWTKAQWQSNRISYFDGHSLKRSQFGKEDKLP